MNYETFLVEEEEKLDLQKRDSAFTGAKQIKSRLATIWKKRRPACRAAKDSLGAKRIRSSSDLSGARRRRRERRRDQAR